MGWILGFTFLLGCVATKPILAQQSNRTSELLLSGNRTDACLEFATVKKIMDCLQRLLECYYGEGFNKYCPDFSETLIAKEVICTGCPWDRVDPEKVIPRIARM